MMEKSETEDFLQAKEIIKELFKEKGITIKDLRPTVNGTSVDFRFKAVTKKGKEIKYAVEIKRNNGRYISSKTLPLLFTKYISMMKERKEDERLIEIFLLPTMFIIFDIDKIVTNVPLGQQNIANWNIPLENYSKLDHRFRLIYFLDFTIMKSESFYKMIYYKLASHLEIYSGFKMEDNCMKSPSEQAIHGHCK